MFYKPEPNNGYEARTYMMVSDNATGPWTSPDSGNSMGLEVFAANGIDEPLEGANGYFDNEGNFVLYVDAYMHGGNADTPFFYVGKTDADGDFKSWTVLGEGSHNINSLSPRHGSVVKITETEEIII